MRITASPGDFVKMLDGEYALVLSTHENDYGIFYNVMLSDGTSVTVDFHSTKPAAES